MTEGWLGEVRAPGTTPHRLTAELPSRGAINSTPIEFLLAPEGSNGEEQKSVKKSAALLRFLAFLFLDHLSGVPRGRAPWAGVRCLGTARLFSLPFLVTKKEGLTEVSH